MINNELVIHKELILGRPVFTVDNFLLDPDTFHDLCFSEVGELHKPDCPNTLNGVYFYDRRKLVYGELVGQADALVKVLTHQDPCHDYFNTNELLLFDESYNNPQDNWWWPHIDDGYNMIIYMNKDGDDCGTNLYYPEDFIMDGYEHANPWIPKNKVRRITHLEGRYNRMVLFDGLIPHGMNLVKGKYTNSYRQNVVGFYLDSIV